MSSKRNFIDQIIQNRTLSHVLFWTVFMFIMTVWSSLNYGSLKDHLINNLALLPVQLLAAYFLVYHQLPKLLLKKKYVQFAISFIVSGYILTFLGRLTIIYLAEPFIRQDFEKESFLEILADPFYLLIVYVPAVHMAGFILMTVKFIKNRFEEKHQLEVLEKEKVKNELKFLKAQIHPHFLFNTLNNLYALSMAKSDVTPKVVVKLSELLDYILYQCNDPLIEVHKEIKLLQGYIDLEMLRYGEQLDLVFNHQVDNPNTQIAPLILLTIIENAFKHGASGNPIDPKIHIDLEVKTKQLYLKVFNNKPPQNLQLKIKKESKGIGTENLNRQLELNYPNKYKLEIKETENTYLVILEIELK